MLTGPPNPTYPADYYAGETTWIQSRPYQGKGITSGGIMDGTTSTASATAGRTLTAAAAGCNSPGYQVAIMQATAGDNRE